MDAGAELVGLTVIPQQQAADASGSYILLATAQVRPAAGLAVVSTLSEGTQPSACRMRFSCNSRP